ncbi:10538_t:CDS:1 [Acaulospora colombiana]|uniref:10538_t:CDS:1 n=1 Tax=Acaulospora colombiana TaxID=27376 RepID=A0ACA9LU73_9GLOM|nr:10538_t:CDS:1 [Acaulospora colombiana]
MSSPTQANTSTAEPSFTQHLSAPITSHHTNQKSFPPSSHTRHTSSQIFGRTLPSKSRIQATKILPNQNEFIKKEFHFTGDDVPLASPPLLQPIKIHRKSCDRNNTAILNQTLENFYDVLKKVSSAHAIESVRMWMKDYEQHRRQVLSEVESESDVVCNNGCC